MTWLNQIMPQYKHATVNFSHVVTLLYRLIFFIIILD